MKDAVKCMNCGTIYPPELVREWGRNKASAGMGPTPKCPAMIQNPHARRARVRDSNEVQIPQQVCNGPLGPVSVANDVELEDVGMFGKERDRGYPGVWRQRSPSPPPE